MNHIFYLHSNTCVISSFDVISELLSRHENIIVVTERNTKFPREDFYESLCNKSPVLLSDRVRIADYLKMWKGLTFLHTKIIQFFAKK